MLRKAGAKEIHVKIASPPVINSCHLGMDTPTKDNLLAANMTREEMNTLIGADSLYYISLEGLVKAAGGENGFCKGCFSGVYPIPANR